MSRSRMRLLVSTVVAGAMTMAAAGVGQIALGGAVANATTATATVSGSGLTATKTVTPAVAYPGDTVTTTIEVVNNEGIVKYLNFLTDYPPAGYVLQSVTGTVYRGTGGDLNDPSVFDGTATQAGDGSVRVRWTDATLRLAKVERNNGPVHPTLTFTYTVPEDATPGPRSTGLDFQMYNLFGDETTTGNPMPDLAVSVAATPTTTAVSAPATAQVGVPTTLTATVTPAKAGTIQFKDGGADIGAPVPVSDGTASVDHTFDAPGAHEITAQFFPSAGNVEGSTSPPQTIDVEDIATSLSVTVPAEALTDEEITLTANVEPQNAAGSVQFQDNGTDIGVPVTVVDGAASMQHTFTTDGTHSITAVFTGDSGFSGSTAPAQTVNVSIPVVPTSTTLTVPQTTVTGEQVEFSAQVSPADAQGTVQFTVGGVSVGDPVEVVNGAASMSFTFADAGQHAVAADFFGATGFTDSSAPPSTVTVDAATVTLLGVPGSATTGVETALSATVQALSGSAVPAGSVQFFDGGVAVGAPTVLTNGSASVPHTFTTVGTHQITAVFTPEAGFAGSTSVQRPVTVSDPDPSDVPSSVVITSSPSATVGVPLTLKAQVIGAPVLPGTVQFFDGGVEIGDPVEVVDGVVELVYTFDSVGPHQIHVVYSGGLGVEGSTSQVQVLEVSESGGVGTGSLGSLGGL
ncbi:Ig-like domain-containing protein [Rhodococcus xishaensis]|nr:Ig-like domain-containing protein [Rhodococcus xishaensis]